MSLYESFRQALDSLKSNKLRSILTMLGIVMGVFSVITIVAIGNAAQASINAEFESLGANTLTISERNRSFSSNDWLYLDDMDIVIEAVPQIENIQAIVQRMATLKVGNSSRDALGYGVTSQFKSFMKYGLVSGRSINEIDISTKSDVLMVDENFAKKYFHRVDIEGETIELKSDSNKTLNLTVLGVLKAESNPLEDIFGDYYPTTVYVPIKTIQRFFNVDKVDRIMISITEKDKLQEVGKRAIRALEFKHGNKGKYYASNSADMQQSLTSIMWILSSVLLVIAVITLLVGGIGIINILLVSVTERTREIGIRKAVGAKKRDIVFQFLMESVIMTGFSGLIGIVLGISTGYLIAYLFNITPVINVLVILFSFIGVILLGLIFGVYPAKKAADLDPVESIRYE
jgi:putative ABC transport system permease protein